MINKMMLAACVAIGVSAGAGGAFATETVKVGLCVSWPGYSSFEVAKEKNLAPDYDIAETIFDDPVGAHSALAAGQIDILYCTSEYTPIAVEQGTNEVMVTFLNPSYGVDQIALAPGVEAKDLKGKKIAAPQAYIGQLLMGVWLDSQGLKPEDVTWVNLNADEAVGPMVAGDLAAAYEYEPWVSKLTASLKGSRSVANSSDPVFLKTGIFMDVLYMNKTFIAERRKAAVGMLKALFLAIQAWHDDTPGVNQIYAKYLKWPVGDVESVVGTNGKFLKGGNYTFDFDEAARSCGVLDGEPPLGISHGGMLQTVSLINDWWVKLGLMKTKVDPAKGVDCSLMADLVKDGFRQKIEARP
jgi:NitT/TauT family transport system substrate-binding protein